MIRSYLKTTLRQLRRQGGYAFINVFGLALGIAVGALIFLFVQSELTFDGFHEKGDRVFRVISGSATPDATPDNWYAWQPYPMAGALKRDIPEIEHTVRVESRQELLRHGDAGVGASPGAEAVRRDLIFADEAFFEVFSFPVDGPEDGLNNPGGIYLSASLAGEMFGDAPPIGRLVEVYLGDRFYPLTVAGVVSDPPANSSVQFDAIASFGLMAEAFEWIRNRENNWRVSSFHTYALLHPEADLKDVESKLGPFYAAYRPDNADRETPTVHALQPLADVHLNTSVQGGLSPTSDRRYSLILAAIALAILAIACINFTTLAIGRSVGRAREVGVRKAAGARRGQLMGQFWGEAMVLATAALFVGVVIAQLLLPEFNALSGRDLAFNWGENLPAVVAVVLMTVAVGMISGAYPAMVLSGFRPVESLYGSPRVGSGRITKSLVVLQFAVSVFLLGGTLVMRHQLEYLQDFNLGFDKENLVVINGQGIPGAVLAKRMETELAGRSDILGVTAVSNAFSHGWSREGWKYREEDKLAYVYASESNVLEVLGVELLSGRTFDPARSTDSTGAVVVNEAFVEMMGWSDPLGQVVEGFYAEPEVVGVFRDINFLSLKQSLEPMVFTLDPDWGRGEVLVRVGDGDMVASLGALEGIWKAVAPELPFSYAFLDDELDAQYANEARWTRIVAYASGFAILLACMGLFGLAALSVAGRRKEIGIRKVLGASVSRIAREISLEFALLVVVASALAAPAAWFAADRWLSGFAFHVEPSVWLFAGVGLAVLLSALLTVGLHAARAAVADPVTSLRYE